MKSLGYEPPQMETWVLGVYIEQNITSIAVARASIPAEHRDRRITSREERLHEVLQSSGAQLKYCNLIASGSTSQVMQHVRHVVQNSPACEPQC